MRTLLTRIGTAAAIAAPMLYLIIETAGRYSG